MSGWMFEMWKWNGWALLAGCLLDWAIGDPAWLPHPVRLMGRMIGGLENGIRKALKIPARQAASPQARQAASPQAGQSEPPQAPQPAPTQARRELLGGALLAAALCGIWAVLPALFFLAAYRVGGKPLLFFVQAFFCGQLLAAKDLAKESMAVARRLEAGDTEGARQAVSMIVGRDTEALDRAGISRAAVETVAENASDGVAAPLLYMAFLGPLGGAVYKAVNTMDSMVGYKNSRYLYFGRAAARLDDALNFIPARINGLLMVGAAWILPGFDGRNAWRIFKRDRKRHASPNAAHGEAACAGALHLRLAGDAWYFGELHKKPFLGDGDRPVEAGDIRRANRLMFTAEGMLAAALAAALVVCAVLDSCS